MKLDDRLADKIDIERLKMSASKKQRFADDFDDSHPIISSTWFAYRSEHGHLMLFRFLCGHSDENSDHPDGLYW